MSCRRLNPPLHSNHQTLRRLDKVAVLFLIAALASSLSFNFATAAGYLATCFQEDGETAISACTAFLASGEGSGGAKSQAHILRGNAYFKKGKNDEALKDYNNAIELVPGNPVALYNRGNIETSLGLYDKAIDDYSRAIRINSQYANAFNNRCFPYNARGRPGKEEGKYDGNPDSLGDYYKAAHDCRRAIELDPAQTKYYLGLGNALSHKQDLDKAFENYKSAIQLDAKNANAFLGQCSVDIKMNDFSRAIKDCGDAIQLDARDPIAWNNRCWARTIIGTELQEALSDCNEALKLQPNDPYALDSRALTYLKMGLFDEAIADYNKALSFQPDRLEALYGRGIAKERISADSGKQDVERAMAKDPSLRETFRTYGVPYDVH
jgi:tetratricopeptide (TPR) repeat protein